MFGAGSADLGAIAIVELPDEEDFAHARPTTAEVAIRKRRECLTWSLEGKEQRTTAKRAASIVKRLLRR